MNCIFVFTIWIKFVALILGKQNIALIYFFKEKYWVVRKIVTIIICDKKHNRSNKTLEIQNYKL